MILGLLCEYRGLMAPSKQGFKGALNTDSRHPATLPLLAVKQLLDFVLKVAPAPIENKASPDGQPC